MISAPVGKSGPLMCLHTSFNVDLGSSNSIRQASTTSDKLCGGISVAMPTAIPDPPFNNTVGNCAGNMQGSSNVPSKLACHSTVPCSSSAKYVSAKALNRDSVYRIAAKDLGSSTDPQFPCPSTNGYRYENGCAINTMAS